MVSKLFPFLAALAFAAVPFIFLMKRRSGKINGGKASNSAAANNGTAAGASSTHASTEGQEIDTLAGYDYEVFLSFRGPDTRSGITDFLYTSLDDAGIRTFKDNDELRVGEEFAPKLRQAINQSKILIPIFSKGYASSVWCLKELVEMIKCQKKGRQQIKPIFYDVAPSEVRYQTGDYAKAFDLHKKKGRHDEKTMQEWKDALSAVGAINGWDLHSEGTNRREGAFAKRVTLEIFSELKRACVEISDHFVSVDHHVDEIMKKIGVQTSETRIVVIHGMGGVGKSTIARFIYNQLLNNFENCCFLSNINETSKGKGIEWLQHRLMSDILKMKPTDMKDRDGEIPLIKYRLCDKQVLLILDDVLEKKHMDALIGKRNWYGRGSKIIITTRNKDILRVDVVDDDYEVSVMDSNQSLQLFSKHAFRRDYPLEGFIQQSNRAIGIAGGLPLALEIIGSLLSCTDKEKWDVTLDKLTNVPHVDVQSKLKISVEALDERQRHIFLDIACLFIGYNKDNVVHFWEKSKFFPKEAMEVLENRSLIKIIEDNAVWMHDQLRDLGREMVRQESKMNIEKQNRVWNPEEALDLLSRNKGKKVEALCLKLDSGGQYRFTYGDFERLPCLRFLIVDGSKNNFLAEERLLWHESPSNVLPTNENSYLLHQLRLLSWYDIPPKFNITNFSMKGVAVLCLCGSEITNEWKGWSHIEVMKNLKVLDLASCHLLVRTPIFAAPVNIERLILRDCKSLIEIDSSICQLKCLVYLDASNCENLHVLPNELGRDLAYLEYLNLSQCTCLEKLPESIWNLESLTELNLNHTGIKELPNSIGKLKNLKALRICCSHISKLPDALWTIEKLEEMEYNGEKLSSCHVEVSKCISLNQFLRILRLKLVDIYALPTLPGSLVSLELLALHMDKFPDLSNLTNLKKLDLTFGAVDFEEVSNGLSRECPIPEWIKELSKLEHLCLNSDYVTPSLRDVSLPPQLKSLSLVCSHLDRLPRLPSSLSLLRLHSCKSLCLMEDLSHLKKLSSLEITFAAIPEIQGLPCLDNLRELQLSWLGQVKMLPDLSNLKKLELFQVRSCDKLVEIEGELPLSLNKFKASSCRSLRKLPDLSSLMMGRKDVEIMYCDNILEKACMDGEKLELVGFKQLQILPDLSKSSELKLLQVEKCGNLVEIQGKLPESLEKLKISSCESLQKLHDLSRLKELRHVVIKGCTKLNGEAIPGFSRTSQANLWENLQHLRICDLAQVEILHDLSKFNKLRCLKVENCGNMIEIQGELPQSLEKLKICSCKSLRNLPDLSSLDGLRRVEIRRCYKLNVEAISSRCSEKVIFVEEDGWI